VFKGFGVNSSQALFVLRGIEKKVAKITALRHGKGRHAKINVVLDGKQTLNLEAEVALKENLKIGQELSSARLDELEKLGHFQRCYDAAAFYLSFRPRSQFELKRQLTKRGFSAENIDASIKRLKEHNLVNDDAFARFWVENRQRFSPRGRRLIISELRQKGVAADTAEQATAAINELDAARRAAASRAIKLTGEEDQKFQQKLGQYLLRRGFSYEISKIISAALRQEMGKEGNGSEA
jgi:regulatory protein